MDKIWLIALMIVFTLMTSFITTIATMGIQEEIRLLKEVDKLHNEVDQSQNEVDKMMAQALSMIVVILEEREV